jgi:phosphoglycolate phosphatase-like HAD superfamily hydrolase
MRVLSLDIDGVLADYEGLVRSSQGLLSNLPAMAGWWAEAKPLVPDERLREFWPDWEVQLVTLRPPWLEAVTLSWVSKHYPSLLPHVARVYFLGFAGSKLSSHIQRPDVAIDDDRHIVAEYESAGVPAILVSPGAESSVTPAVRDLQ